MKNQDESLQELELDLGLPKGFCIKLLEEDDWSFVIKLHALLESAVGGIDYPCVAAKAIVGNFFSDRDEQYSNGQTCFR